MKKSIESPSPNYDDRPESGPVNMVVLHYTGMKSGEEALARLCDPAAKVSAHYLIEEDGCVYSLVPEEKRAWHAGVSSWKGWSNINHRSLGIELVNPGHEFGYRPFPEVQIESLLMLLDDIKKRHKIRPDCYVGHSDIAPDRKEDPGELFPWRRLEKEGFGLWRDDSSETVTISNDNEKSIEFFNKQLGFIGYDVSGKTENHAYMKAVIRAFQAHWCSGHPSGVLDAETKGVIANIATQVEKLGTEYD